MFQIYQYVFHVRHTFPRKIKMETVSKIVHSFDLLYKETIKKAMYIFVQNLLFLMDFTNLFLVKSTKKVNI